MELPLNQLMSLREAYRRAKEANSGKEKQAIGQLTDALRAGSIQCFSTEFTIHESRFCWVFPREILPFRHKSKNFNMKTSYDDFEYVRTLEKEAYDIAYDEHHKSNESFHKIIGEESIFVFTGIEPVSAGDGRDKKLPMYDISQLTISDDKEKILFERVFIGDKCEDQPFSIYWRNQVFSSVSAVDVKCSRIDVEAQFPYSINNPKRKGPGRPSKYRDRAFAYLDKTYPDGVGLPRVGAKTIAHLLVFFDSVDPNGKRPDTSVWYDIIGDWKKSRIPNSGN